MPTAVAVDEAISREAIELERLALQTDLWHLCHALYPPPQYMWSESVHREVCGKFFVQKNPEIKPAALDTRKKRLWLDPRNHFKTTVDIADIVQWILCYPNIRILIASGTRDNAIKMLKAVKAHFQYNEVIRYFFPRHCPEAKKVEDFGTQDSFTCPCRTEKDLREPTVSVASPDATVAGMHYEILKFDDLVNETNSRTREGLQQVNQWFKLTNPLLERGGYRDVIGTRYDYSDCYGEILGDDFTDEHVIAKMHGDYLVSKRSCYLPDGSILFPERFDHDFFKNERKDMGSWNFSNQYLNSPLPDDASFFPKDKVEKCLIDRKKLPVARTKFTTLDLAISQSAEADNTAILTCSVGRLEGDTEVSLFIEHLHADHAMPEQTVMRLFEVFLEHKPIQIRTEEVGFTALLKPLIQAESARRGIHLPMIWMRRDSKETKQARIAALQPFIERRQIRIVNDLPQLSSLMSELVKFPKYRRDDIIDALADQIDFLNMFRQSPVDMPLPELTSRNGQARLGLMA